LAVVAEGKKGRGYLAANAVPSVDVSRPQDLKGLDAPLANDPRNLWCLNYGLTTFDRLFTPLQLVSLTTLSSLVQEARHRVLQAAMKGGLPKGEDSLVYADAVATYLAFGGDKCADSGSTLCVWQTKMNRMRSTFARHALPMTWDFVET